MRLEHHLVGGYVRYISPHVIIIINSFSTSAISQDPCCIQYTHSTPPTTQVMHATGN